MRISDWSSDVCSSDLNGSTDGGRELAAAIGDERIKLLDLAAPGPGGYAGRNIGIRAASGDWIAFLDADDLWQSDHLAVLAEGIGADPGVRAVATRFDHIFDDRSQPQRIAPELDRARRLDFAAFLAASIAVRACPVWTGAIAIRRDTLFDARSEERRVGKEWVGKCGSRWSPFQ